METLLGQGRALIENVEPQVSCGRFRAKAVVDDEVEVTADIFRDSPALLQAVILHRGPSEKEWSEEPMEHVGNDAWLGTWRPAEIGRHEYTIRAFTDHFATWRRDLIARADAGQDLGLELVEGARLIEARLDAVPPEARPSLRKAAAAVRGDAPGAAEESARLAAALDDGLLQVMTRYAARHDPVTFGPALELTVDRELARFGAWYELFPRSTGAPGEHGTFKTAAAALPDIARMGYDVLYLPPIHPIGVTNRKGRNNAVIAGPQDVGVPWAIGSDEGGHRDVHPYLGTLEDFDGFVVEARRLGMEVALDFAVQCSPDHPWVKEHPQWFARRPDGTIRYAENPPKKYQDIYPIDFATEDKQGLWTELLDILLHWIGHGVKIFRVDNPHTKSFPFWEWVIDTVQGEHPDVIFLSEAFTRPKVMKGLAKLGFTQSYTYFTWRNDKWGLTEYLLELSATDMTKYFRPNFFTNTQDILHEYLQHGGPPAFKVRLVLAAMLAPSYGVYSGFELYERTPREPGSEEYLDSEKYELKPRDFSTMGNLRPFMTKINEIRATQPPLRWLTNLRFHTVDREHLMVFSKSLPGTNPIVVVVNLNPWDAEEGTVELDLGPLGLPEDAPYAMHDLLSGATYEWSGRWNYVRLDPQVEPAHIFRAEG